MAAKRFSLSFFRRVSGLVWLGAQHQEVYAANIVTRRFYSPETATKTSGSSLDRLISNLTNEKNAEEVEISTVSNVESLIKICSKMDDPISGGISVRVLTRFAELAVESGDVQRATIFLKKKLLAEMDKSLKSDMLNINSTLEAICALVTLDLSQEAVFETLIGALRRHFSTDLLSAPISPVVRLAALVNSKKTNFPDDLFGQIKEWLQLKANEITEPRDVASMMICWNKNDSWFNVFVEKAKGCISSMSSSELVGLMASLASSSSRPPHVLRLICSIFEQNKQSLTISELLTLSQSAAKLQLMDNRLRRLIAAESCAHINRFTKWSQINSIVSSLAKLHIGHSQTWDAVAAWINNNQMVAAAAELSYAVHWCAVAGKGHLIQKASGFLCEKLTSSSVDSPRAWLSTIYALAVCNRLSSELAQTILQPSFVINILEGVGDFQKLMTVTTIAQVQYFLKGILNKDYQGPSIDMSGLMRLPPATVNDMALRLRYGKSEEGNARYFHSLLHKIAPVNSHAVPPALTKDGIFVNAVIKLDVRRNRFIPLSDFDETNVSRLAVIYLSWRDRTLPCNDDDKTTLMGSMTLNLRLLKARGFIPVLFSQEDLNPNTSLKQQFIRIKTKLEEASRDREDRY
uniref:RAP domain-containing protein n=1 Tax=Setaria digitata TaxID=48799 RepID=A0A915PR96_9BILA